MFAEERRGSALRMAMREVVARVRMAEVWMGGGGGAMGGKA